MWRFNPTYLKMYIYITFTGVLHSGSGHTQITNFMSALEIEGMHHCTMKSRETEVEPHIHSVAKQSCSNALTEEKERQRYEIRYMYIL